MTETVESGFDPVSGTVLSRRRRRLGALVLSDRTEPADPAAVAEALARAVAAEDCGRCRGATPRGSSRRGSR